MRDYFIRRFLLIPPTLLVITMVVFGVTRIAPGGPLERAMMEAQMVSMDGGGGRSEGAALSEDQLKQMEELYGYDKPAYEAYLIWLGVLPRELNIREVVFINGSMTATTRTRVPTFHIAELDWDKNGFVERIEVPESIKSYVNFDQVDVNGDGMVDGYEAESPNATVERPRERIQLKRDKLGEVTIVNIGDSLVPWQVRMIHPFDEIMEPLESAYEMYLPLVTESRSVLVGFEKEFSKFMKGVRVDSQLAWGEAYKKLKAESSRMDGLISRIDRLSKEVENKEAREMLGKVKENISKAKIATSADPKAEVFRTRYAGVLQGDLGKSFRHGEPVFDVISERLPISTFYGLLTFSFIYLVCVPLGIVKAMKHNTLFDNGSSVFIFMGYAIPGYVLGALMMVFLASRWGWFPTGGFVGPNYESLLVQNVSVEKGSGVWRAPVHGLSEGQEVWLQGAVPAASPTLENETAYLVSVQDRDNFQLLPEAGAPAIQLQANAARVVLHRHTSMLEKAKDLAWHTVLPLISYLVGSFAFVTMLMKNHLMDNLSADYMRTAIAKGVPFSQAVRQHALRNSFIPLATSLGHQITLFLTGSFLIETIFDINGFGLLGFKSVLDRDFPVVLGILLLSATLLMLGNIISDILVALVDPRVRFN